MCRIKQPTIETRRAYVSWKLTCCLIQLYRTRVENFCQNNASLFKRILLSMPNLPFEHEDDGNLALQEARPKLSKPPMYTVLLLNDDFTPMDFVVSILQTIFYKEKEEAVRITMNVHTSGIGVCGVYTKDIAETKVQQVIAYAQENQHPLQCTLEEVE